MATRVANCSGVALRLTVTALIAADREVPPMLLADGGTVVVLVVVVAVVGRRVVRPAATGRRPVAFALAEAAGWRAGSGRALAEGVETETSDGSTRFSLVCSASTTDCRNATLGAGRSPVRPERNRSVVARAEDVPTGSSRSPCEIDTPGDEAEATP